MIFRTNSMVTFPRFHSFLTALKLHAQQQHCLHMGVGLGPLAVAYNTSVNVFVQLWHLTHWGQVTHICVGNLTIIGPDNGLSPGRRQAIIWTNAGILLIGLWGTNFSEILIGIQTFSFKKMHLKMSSAKWRPFCLSLNVLAVNCEWGIKARNPFY